MDLIQVIREEKISLIHANTFEAIIIAGIASKIVRIPIIYHKRFVFSHGFVDRIADMLCDKIILVSKAAMWDFARHVGNSSKYVVIYNGVSLQEYSLDVNPQDIKTEFCIAESTKVVGTVCRISPEKGLDFFLQAAKRVVNIFPDSKFIIVGGAFFETDRVYQSELKKLASNLSLSNHVIFTGFRNDVARVMAGMDIVVLPSVIDDAFPRAPLEAMALAKPVVATKVGGVPEAVIDKVTGLLVSPRDSDLLANAIITLLDNSDLASKMGIAGRNRVEQLFDADKKQQEIEQLFMEVITHRTV
jgi:glycosyltransferase involved in cell wall biosynthesis